MNDLAAWQAWLAIGLGITAVAGLFWLAAHWDHWGDHRDDWWDDDAPPPDLPTTSKPDQDLEDCDDG